MSGAKVVLATFGSYGDLHPFMALALELQALGLRPVIATTAAYRDKIEREGIAFHAVRPAPEQVEQATGLGYAALAGAVTRHSVEFILRTFVLPYLGEAFDDLSAVSADADLVVISSFAVAAQIAAEALRKPTLCVTLSPIAMMSEEDPPVLEQLPFLPELRRLFGPTASRLVYGLGRRRLAAMNAEVDAARRAAGLPPGSGDAFLDAPYRADEVAALYSPLLAGLREHAPKPTHPAGFAFFDRDGPNGESLSAETEAFLIAGEAPLVFTLGSFAVLTAERFYEQAAAASRRLGRRAVLLVGRDAEADLRHRLGAPDILVLGYAPHSLLFPRAAVVIHHGGIGTTGQGLRSGAPQLVCPIFGDQPDNARRVRRLGVGAALPYRRFNVRRAANALAPLLNDRRIRSRAQEAAAVVSQENGARWLAEHIAARLMRSDQRL